MYDDWLIGSPPDREVSFWEGATSPECSGYEAGYIPSEHVMSECCERQQVFPFYGETCSIRPHSTWLCPTWRN